MIRSIDLSGGPDIDLILILVTVQQINIPRAKTIMASNTIEHAGLAQINLVHFVRSESQVFCP